MRRPLATTIFFNEADSSTRILLDEPILFDGGVVPHGFVSDGASVPRIFWRLLDPPISARTLVPSVIHDYLYQAQTTTRAAADALYYRDLRAHGYARWKSALVWLGVRLGGWVAWRDHKRRKPEGQK